MTHQMTQLAQNKPQEESPLRAGQIKVVLDSNDPNVAKKFTVFKIPYADNAKPSEYHDIRISKKYISGEHTVVTVRTDKASTELTFNDQKEFVKKFVALLKEEVDWKRSRQRPTDQDLGSAAGRLYGIFGLSSAKPTTPNGPVKVPRIIVPRGEVAMG